MNIQEIIDKNWPLLDVTDPNWQVIPTEEATRLSLAMRLSGHCKEKFNGSMRYLVCYTNCEHQYKILIHWDYNDLGINLVHMTGVRDVLKEKRDDD